MAQYVSIPWCGTFLVLDFPGKIENERQSVGGYFPICYQVEYYMAIHVSPGTLH